MKLSLSRVHFPINTLGPGRRVGIWFQGCSLRCPGCVSPETWEFKTPSLPVAELARGITPWLEDSAGVTISGGEPFDQPEALLELLRAIKAVSSKSVLVFSGYDASKIAPVLEKARPHIDALVSGPYRADAPQTLALRGSDNQRLHLLTPDGRREFAAYETPGATAGQALDLMFDADGSVWLAGIPRKQDMTRLRLMMNGLGYATECAS